MFRLNVGGSLNDGVGDNKGDNEAVDDEDAVSVGDADERGKSLNSA